MPSPSKELRYLRELTAAVLVFLRESDVLMKQPSSVERGHAIAKLTNALEFANDQARYFGLGIDYRTDKKRARTYVLGSGK